MHTTALHFIPVLAAEKSRTAFYVIAGVLAAWAVVISVGVGLRRSSFPSNGGGARLVMLISAVLVVATMASGVITSSTPSKAAGKNAAGASQPAGPSPSAGSAAPLKVAANSEGQLAFDTKQLQAKAGQVTITFTNSAPLEHNLTIAEGSHVVGATATFRGSSRTLKLNLKPGTYTFYCSVPGHRQAGMEGKLRVS